MGFSLGFSGVGGSRANGRILASNRGHGVLRTHGADITLPLEHHGGVRRILYVKKLESSEYIIVTSIFNNSMVTVT